MSKWSYKKGDTELIYDDLCNWTVKRGEETYVSRVPYKVIQKALTEKWFDIEDIKEICRVMSIPIGYITR